MKCEQTSELLPDYLEGRLSPDRHHDLAAHLAECANCSEELYGGQASARAGRNGEVSRLAGVSFTGFVRPWGPRPGAPRFSPLVLSQGFMKQVLIPLPGN